ncbi:hypothetical protein [Aurantiacibacter rhizosphaerae]|uniref:DUF2157 domain-containing protein n=1 Tax=Aurantiacibacter rhizosphaerae TaxID=2691582 RepID=A0A844XEJ0_9SPHN|nr:hypothetical protein [Aurantiacibacter rhizosphaerae]MWV28260.1 hypothetical protein [Aurantiacibacter rhizosphaerae]
MRSEIDLDAAARAGIIDEHVAIALRNFQAQSDGIPHSSAEKFRLFGGYADLVSAMGMGLILAALSLLAIKIQMVLLCFILAAVTFAIACKIDMRAGPALASVLLLSWLFNAVVVVPAALEAAGVWGNHAQFKNAVIVVGLTALATWIYWRRFRFPPTFAVAMTGASLVIINVVQNYSRGMYGFDVINWLPAVVALVLAILTLLWAIWWDLSDIRRETERSQVAFWLHCTAGFLVTRAIFSLLTGGEVINGHFILTGLAFTDIPWLAMMIFVAAIISLLLDRRSLLTGVLLPVIGIFGEDEGAVVVGMIIAGAGLLLFNYGWIRLRIGLLALLPAKIEAQLPRTNLALQGQRPSRRHLPLWPQRQ